MIVFEVDNIFTKLVTETREEFQTIRSLLSFYADGYQFSKAYRRGKWNGKICFLTSAGRFPTGLLPYVLKKLPLWLKNSCKIHDRRNVPDIRYLVPSLKGIELRPYQKRFVINACRKKRGVIWAPAGSGKTEIALAIIAALQYPKTLYLVHQKDLLHQTARRISQRTGIRAGTIGDGYFVEGRITVATVQSLWQRIKQKDPITNLMLRHTRLLILDECHHASATTWYKIAMKTDAYFRFGLSATPLTKSSIRNFRLFAATAAIIVDRITENELAAQGYLCYPTIKMIRVNAAPLPAGLPFKIVYERGIVRNSVRNAIIAEQVKTLLEEDKSVLILVEKIEHGKILSELLESPFLSGKEPLKTRKKMMDALSGKHIRVLVATTIFDEGIDIPTLDSVILAGGGKSYIRLIQRIGRSMRTVDSKQNAIIIDFLDTCHHLLKRHSAERLKLYKTKNYPVTII